MGSSTGHCCLNAAPYFKAFSDLMKNLPVHRRLFAFDAGSPSMMKLTVDGGDVVMYPRQNEDNEQS